MGHGLLTSDLNDVPGSDQNADYNSANMSYLLEFANCISFYGRCRIILYHVQTQHVYSPNKERIFLCSCLARAITQFHVFCLSLEYVINKAVVSANIG